LKKKELIFAAEEKVHLQPRGSEADLGWMRATVFAVANLIKTQRPQKGCSAELC
jgi:hypothetical protein